MDLLIGRRVAAGRAAHTLGRGMIQEVDPAAFEAVIVNIINW